MKKSISLLLAALMILTLAACGGAPAQSTAAPTDAGKTVYTVGICNFVDDASLNQIIANIRARLDELSTDEVGFTVLEDNCNLDANVMNQIITNFLAQKVDLMVGVATPAALGMDAPGANLTGTSDYLDTNAVMNLIFAADPDADCIGLLYNMSEDSSTAPIKAAKEYLEQKGVQVVERTGTTVDEVMLAAEALVKDGVDAVFTPTDNTIMTAELAIYETFAEAGIPHYTGADSFALNGAFLGYGVDYAKLGAETADMIAEILLEGKDPGTVPVRTFDNGTATVNTEICEKLGFDYDKLAETFAPFCTRVQPITTAESFDDLK